MNSILIKNGESPLNPALIWWTISYKTTWALLPTLYSTLTHVQTLETHASLYQYIVNQQLQADSINNHLGTISAATVSYETQVEVVCTFCQTLDHPNH